MPAHCAPPLRKRQNVGNKSEEFIDPPSKIFEPYLARWVDRWQMDFFDPPLAFMTVPTTTYSKFVSVENSAFSVKL